MSTIIRHYSKLSATELDAYLEKGWRTTGQAVYNCNFLRLEEEGQMVSVLPMRLKLENHRLSKSMRKIVRRNLERFKVVFGPGHAGCPEAHRVNKAYMREKPAKTLEGLEYHLLGVNFTRVLNTWECRIYDRHRLVAISYFDLGENSAYGKAGIYDPEYRQCSLGLFTMAMELEFCQRRGLDHYFPGYVSDEHPIFDYKHRIGEMDYFDLFTQTWLPYESGASRQKPLNIIKEKLEAAISLLDGHERLEPELLMYPFLDVCYSSRGWSNYLDVPLFVFLKQTGYDTHHVLLYLPDQDIYQVVKVKESQIVLARGEFDKTGVRNSSFVLMIEKILIRDNRSVEEITKQYLDFYCI